MEQFLYCFNILHLLQIMWYTYLVYKFIFDICYVLDRR